ncbi:head-tail adaptor Ad1 [Arthrobacter phage Phives]|uniref:Head-to-tail adaptor n=1 Tax=Arthrobacter phage Phives TaxID=2776856 RepID=A0A7M1CLI7_9CAUD|nr:head-tail adaptor Ad1 [Arthrobacter phage Phives]QOP65137.1 head-to-tail adaptor [Arthrobacter phage Phives]
MPTPLPPPVSSLERRLGLPEGSLEGEDLARAQEALDDAATLALAEVPATKAALWAADAPKVVVLVVLKAARREFENPRGMASESLGEHTVGLTDTSGVYLTAREIAQIKRAATGRAGGFVGTVRTPSAYFDPLNP